MDTFQLLARGLANHLGIDVSEITPETELMALGVDSLDAAELLMELDDKLGVEVELTTTSPISSPPSTPPPTGIINATTTTLSVKKGQDL